MPNYMHQIGVAKHLHPSYLTLYFGGPEKITNGTDAHQRWTPGSEVPDCDDAHLTAEGRLIFDRLISTGWDIDEIWTAGDNYLRVMLHNPLNREGFIRSLQPLFADITPDAEIITLEGYIS